MLLTNFFTKLHHELPDSDQPLGWIAIASCVFAFGSYGVFIKTPAVSDLKVDPGVFQVYYSVATAATLMCVAFYSHPVHFSTAEFLWGTLGAGLWVISQLLGFVAINSIGYAVGPAIWAATTMVVSYVWGVSMLGDKPKSIALSVVALGTLVLGITIAAFCNSTLFDKLYLKCLSPERKEERQRLFDSISISESVNNDTRERSPEETISRFRFYLGIVCAVMLGLFNGSLQVPFYYYRQHIGKENYKASISYLVNFSAGIAVTTPVICFVWWMIRFQKIPPFHFMQVLFPGLATGFYWACGYCAATYATLYLGNTVGYPLTQTCIVINGLWGIIYYKEIRGAHKIIAFMSATVIIIGGAVILALYGMSTK
ncbi:transmembrane protein 144 homolog B-like isoform X2 [Corticium candelabrum]|nr:transmembrane protein 144 homolog B-like isoform X2 [Corticium candelabrum]